MQKIKADFGSLNSKTMADLPDNSFSKLLKVKRLHRYPEIMGRNIADAFKLIASDYQGDASRIWSNTPSSALVILRFLQFKGVGPKLASMAANILARDIKVQFSDYYSIDISVDVHVRRVFRRLGLIDEKSSKIDTKHKHLIDM